MARIVTVYTDRREEFAAVDMSYIRWLKVSQALARKGHQVDIATGESRWRPRWWKRPAPLAMGTNLRRVPLAGLRWSDYDVVKTLFHIGFETLEQHGGTGHPFIISKLGSVVGSHDMPGVYFYGARRSRLAAVQERISRTSHYVTLLSEQARALWRSLYGSTGRELLVPGGVDAELPPPGASPYPDDGQQRCVFAGHVYFKQSQPEANRVLVDKLNGLGQRLSACGVRLYAVGPGDLSRLDRSYVTHLGVVGYDAAWNYIQHADVGVVVAPGPFVHNNESTKIYHYLRAGLPVVSEAGFPNDHVVAEARLGFAVPNGDLDEMARRVVEATRTAWDRAAAVEYTLRHHTWDVRVDTYESVIASRLMQGAQA